jgi:hypothetical protein
VRDSADSPNFGKIKSSDYDSWALSENERFGRYIRIGSGSPGKLLKAGFVLPHDFLLLEKQDSLHGQNNGLNEASNSQPDSDCHQSRIGIAILFGLVFGIVEVLGISLILSGNRLYILDRRGVGGFLLVGIGFISWLCMASVVFFANPLTIFGLRPYGACKDKTGYGYYRKQSLHGAAKQLYACHLPLPKHRLNPQLSWPRRKTGSPQLPKLSIK